MPHLTPHAIYSAALTLCCLPAQAVLSVGPGSSYSTIQSAISAASPGDCIVVTSGFYFEDLYINKSLRITQSIQASWTPLVRGNITIDGVDASGFVTISGLTVMGNASGDRLLVSNCQGPVVFDRLTASEIYGGPGVTAWCQTNINYCTSVTFNDCSVADVVVQSSTVSFSDCTVSAALKTDTSNTCAPTARPGQCGSTDSVITASSTSFVGAPILSTTVPSICLRQNPVVYCQGSYAFALTNSQLTLGRGCTASSPLSHAVLCDQSSTIAADSSLASINYGTCATSLTEAPSLLIQGMAPGASGLASVVGTGNSFVILLASYPATPSYHPLFTLPIGLDLPNAWFAASGITDSQGMFNVSFTSGLGLGPPGLTFCLQAVVLNQSSTSITPWGMMVIH